MTAPQRRPHVLYVAWGFPPARTGGVHRALATANAFADGGWRVTVLTAPREVFLNVTGADEALEAEVHPDVTVVRLPFSWPARSTDVRGFSPVRVLTPRLWSLARSRLDRLSFPEIGYGPWRPTLERAALAAHRDVGVDLVVATTNPQVSVTAGVRLADEAGVPYVVDFRDAWTLHTYSGQRRIPADSPAGRWEARAIEGAAEVWLVNEPLRRWHADAYPSAAGRMHVVMNGYDRDLPRPGPPGDPLRFGYLGTLTPVVPLRELVAGWRYAKSMGAHGQPRGPAGGRALDPVIERELQRAQFRVHGYLGYYATPDPGLAAVLDDGAAWDLRYAGPVSKTEVGATYAGFDVLVLALGGGEYVTSGKVFEYMSTGLPIVSVLTPGGAAADVLAAYPRHHRAADLSPAAVAAAQAAARAFRRDVQLEPRVAALRALVRAA